MDNWNNKIVIVTRKTRLAELIYKYNTIEQAKFYIEHMGVDFSDYILEDENYRKALARVRDSAALFGRVQEIDREFVPNMIFGRNDIVVAVGQDGLVANVMKYLDGQPLIGVNPDTNRWDGVLLPFEADQLKDILPKVAALEYNIQEVTMAEAVTRDGQSMLAVNDLFIGCRTHTSALYDIILNGVRENHSSSGVIVSTGLGSSGWYKSVIDQVQRIAEAFGAGRIADTPLKWDDEQLAFTVREAFPSRATQANLIFGRIKQDDRFTIISKMPANGVVFSDGMEDDAISFLSGTEVSIGIAKQKGKLVVR